jgi:MYXO-CTERM domain-containing protein
VRITKQGKAALVAASFLMATPAAVQAQDRDDERTTRTTTTTREDDREFPWGLLGLLGLLGLGGLAKRRERDIHVDNRRHSDPPR